MMATTEMRAPFVKDRPAERNGDAPATAVVVKEEAPARQPRKRAGSKALLILAGALVLGAGIVWGGRAWQFGTTHVVTDDAYLTSDTAPITPQVAGNVARVL